MPMMGPNLAEILIAFIAKVITNQRCYQDVFNDFMFTTRENGHTIREMRGKSRNKPLLDITNLRVCNLHNKEGDRQIDKLYYTEWQVENNKEGEKRATIGHK